MGLSVSQGFENEAIESSLAFRTLLDAMAKPGKVHDLPIKLENIDALSRGSTLAILTLTDYESHVWLDEKLSNDPVKDFIRFHCSAQITTKANQAMFAVFASTPDVETLDEFAIGTSDYPDTSVTLIIQVERLSEELGVALQGPGIKSSNYLKAKGLNDEFWTWWHINNARFPLGIDVILTTEDSIAALPRTVRVMEAV